MTLERARARVVAASSCWAQQVGKALHVGEGDLGQRLAGKVKEAAGVGSIGALGMTASSVEPKAEELGVRVPEVFCLARLRAARTDRNQRPVRWLMDCALFEGWSGKLSLC